MIQYSRMYDFLHMFTVLGKTTNKTGRHAYALFYSNYVFNKTKENTNPFYKYRGEGASSVLAVLTSLGLRVSCPQTTFILKLFQTFIPQMRFPTDCRSLK